MKRSLLALGGVLVAVGVGAACGGSNAVIDLVDTPPDAGSDTGGLPNTSTSDASATDGSVGDDAAADGSSCPDVDKDGVTTCAGDCDDSDPDNFPGNVEICGDAKDNNCNSQVDEGCGGLGTFVAGDPAKGDDLNPGTRAQPVRTIVKGMQNAATIKAANGAAQTVYVAQGHYPEKITLVEGISLSGGYACNAPSCTWARDPIVYDTAIDNTDYQGVLAGSTITRATRLDGFRLRGRPYNGTGVLGAPTNTGSACLTVNGGAPTISNNRLEPGAVTNANGGNNRSHGIAVISPTNVPGPAIDGNTILGASATDASIGVFFSGAGASAIAVITNNKITGGASANSRGIAGFSSAAGTVIRKNEITCGSATGDSWGIQLAGVATIDRNKINVDQANVGTCTANAWCGAIDTGGATATITSNILYGAKGSRTTAVRLRDFETALGVVILNGNYLDGAGVGLTSNPTTSAALVLGVAGGINVFVGRVRNNILLGGINLNRFGVFEDPSQGGGNPQPRTVHPEAFENNDIFFLPARAPGNDFLYRLMSAGTPGTATTYTSIATIETGGPASVPPPVPMKNNGVAANNISADPALDNTLHLTRNPPSPCINAGVTTEAPANDYDGDNRPSGARVDIGHDEAP